MIGTGVAVGLVADELGNGQLTSARVFGSATRSGFKMKNGFKVQINGHIWRTIDGDLSAKQAAKVSAEDYAVDASSQFKRDHRIEVKVFERESALEHPIAVFVFRARVRTEITCAPASMLDAAPASHRAAGWRESNCP